MYNNYIYKHTYAIWLNMVLSGVWQSLPRPVTPDTLEEYSDIVCYDSSCMYVASTPLSRSLTLSLYLCLCLFFTLPLSLSLSQNSARCYGKRESCGKPPNQPFFPPIRHSFTAQEKQRAFANEKRLVSERIAIHPPFPLLNLLPSQCFTLPTFIVLVIVVVYRR